MSDQKGWIGVDLDGTLAEYDVWRGPEHIGAPIPAMVARVKEWLAEGKDVRIFTARVGGEPEANSEARRHIFLWCMKHLGHSLTITATKDYGMVQLWDDRCVQVVPNTGERADQKVATGIELLVCEDIARRQTHGKAKYGTTVVDNPLPLRAWLQHALEESLDHAVYLKRAIWEIDSHTVQAHAALPPKA